MIATFVLRPLLVACFIFAWCAALGPAILTAGEDQAAGQAPDPEVERINYLTFAQGAVPLTVGGAATGLGASFEQALRATDGNPARFVLTLKPGPADTDAEFVYQLPALTTFDRFAVPTIPETPSPGETFTKQVEVYGSAAGSDREFVLLASGVLQASKSRGELTELSVRTKPAVRWVKLRLVGGIDVTRPATFFEFTEIIGNGIQQTPGLVDHFTGTWQGRGVLVGLKQAGPVVSGCYDTGGDLTGTVTGNILRATGVDRSTGVISLFILSVTDDGTLRGVRSTNKGPFNMYTGAAAPAGVAAKCREIPPPALGCGSIIHGITFGFNSADIRPESTPVLVKLYEGLRDDRSASIVIEGHTSSEGADAYNQGLSERRAQAVATDVIRRGLDSRRVTWAGVGESRPLAPNTDENGRSLNRRVEVRCK